MLNSMLTVICISNYDREPLLLILAWEWNVQGRDKYRWVGSATFLELSSQQQYRPKILYLVIAA